jgi:hypothetical protein
LIEEITDDLKKEILDFLDKAVTEFDATEFTNVDDVKRAVQAYLYSKLTDQYKNTINVAPLFKMANEYVTDHIRIDPNQKKEESKDETVESQL